MDVVRLITTFNAGRDPQRLELKYAAMRGDPFAFLRGTCHLFYQRLPREGIFKSAPRVWSCGDLHLENFGSYKGDNRLVYFDINDFDEAVLAPASWDLVRLLASLRICTDALRIAPAQVQSLCRSFVDSYATALAQGKAYWVERDTATGLVHTLLDGLKARQRPAFLDMRTDVKGKRRVLRIDGKKALAPTETQRRGVLEFMRKFSLAQPEPDFYKPLDVARRIAGTGSLGVDRYVILVQGKGSPDGNYLLDLKQACPSSLATRLRVQQPHWKSEAHRVVELQRRMQAVSMAFLQAVKMNGQPYVLRGLQPAEDRIALRRQRVRPDQLEHLVGMMGHIVAWAQLRSAGREGSVSADELIDYSRRKKWKQELLAAAHEAAAQVRRDARTYDAAWADGAFDAR